MSYYPSEALIIAFEEEINNTILVDDYNYNGKKIQKVKAKYNRSDLLGMIDSGYESCIKYTGLYPSNDKEIIDWAKYIYLAYLNDSEAAQTLFTQLWMRALPHLKIDGYCIPKISQQWKYYDGYTTTTNYKILTY